MLPCFLGFALRFIFSSDPRFVFLKPFFQHLPCPLKPFSSTISRIKYRPVATHIYMVFPPTHVPLETLIRYKHCNVPALDRTIRNCHFRVSIMVEYWQFMFQPNYTCPNRWLPVCLSPMLHCEFLDDQVLVLMMLCLPCLCQHLAHGKCWELNAPTHVVPAPAPSICCNAH